MEKGDAWHVDVADSHDHLSAVFGDAPVFVLFADHEAGDILHEEQRGAPLPAELDKVAELLNAKVIFDGRNIYPTEQMEQLGFNYFSVGRKAVVNTTKPASVTNE